LSEKGYLTFGGDASYETSFAYNGEKRLLLTVETKDTVEVLVNGVSAGVRFCAPYTFDLTALAKKGENALSLRVTTTLSSFIYKTVVSGVLGAHLFAEK
jgi:hypothetical protein